VALSEVLRSPHPTISLFGHSLFSPLVVVLHVKIVFLGITSADAPLALTCPSFFPFRFCRGLFLMGEDSFRC